MAWMETDVISERQRFVVLHSTGGLSMSELCRRFGVSRPTGYKWLRRYEERGMEGLEDHARSPRSCPHRTSSAVEAAILGLRAKHPRWGPVTLRALLERQEPSTVWPAASTIGEILRRHGLVRPRKRRRAIRHAGRPIVAMERPNDVWSADYKGEFKTRDGRLCYPLTIADGYSRYLLACRGRRNVQYVVSRPVFEEAFAQYGLPRQLLTDNGSPFGTPGLTGLTRLSVWWIELGIHPIRIQPGRPDQNGRHERMHRTLKEEIYPPAGNLSAQQRRLNGFRQEYNELRPHHALELQPPATLFEPSPRPYRGRVPDVVYPKHFLVKQLHADGRLYWHGRRTRRISKALACKPVGLEAIEEDVYQLYFGPVLLGVFNTATWTIHV